MRTMIMTTALVLASAAQAQSPVQAPAPGWTPTTECPAMTAAPANFAGWEKPAPIDAGLGGTAATPLALSSAAQVTLVKQGNVTLHGGAKPDGSFDPFGGVLAIDIASPGVYQVAVSADAWVDIVGGNAVLQPSGDRKGPNCTSIAKILDYKLDAGRYLLEISGARAATLAVMIAPTGR